MPSEKPLQPLQVEKFTPLYVDFYHTLKPVVREVLNNDQVDRAIKVKAAADAVSSIRNLTSQMFEVLDDPQKREVAELIAKAEKTSAVEDRATLEARLRDLFPGEFPNKPYHSFVDAIAETTNAILTGYGKDLKDVPKTFGEILVSATRQKAREVLAGMQEVRVPELAVAEEKPGTHEAEPFKAAPAPTPAETKKFETWKKGWFEGEIDLTRTVKVEKEIEMYTKAKDKKEALDFTENGIMSIQNLNELREVALSWMTVMYSTNEVQEESFNRRAFSLMIQRARELDKAEGGNGKYFEHFNNMVNGAREFYVFWQEQWIGTANNGVGVNMVSIATGAARFPDSTPYISFFMKQKPIIEAFHTQNMKEGGKAISGLMQHDKTKEALWNVVGHRLRRSTGQAIYDNIDYLTEQQLDRVVTLALTQIPEGLPQKEYDEKIQHMETEMANVVFGINSEIKPHTVDYQLFLNHFIPWYLNVRYREKFKINLDLLYQQAHDLSEEFHKPGHGTAPGIMGKEEYEKMNKSLEAMFDHFNIGEIGAYSMWKRPDTSNSWIENLKIITYVGRVYYESHKETDPEKIKGIFTRLKGEVDRRMAEKSASAPHGLIQQEIDKYEGEKRAINSAEAAYLDLAKNNKNFENFLIKGADFGMKMVSIYDDKQDKRTSRQWIDKWKDIYGNADWSLEHLLGINDSEKFRLLGKFLDFDTTRLTDQHEVIRNNLIRTVLINEKIKEKITQKIQEADKEDKVKLLNVPGFLNSPIYEEFIDLDELYQAGTEPGTGETWMRFFDCSPTRFSFNAFVIYEGYASKTREIIHKVFDKTTPITDILKLREQLESMTAFKQGLDTAMAYVNEATGSKEYHHAVAWRTERILNAIEDYVSSMFVLSIALHRKQGVRQELAVYVNQSVSTGVKDSFFKKHHFEPAKSAKEKGEDREISYAKYLEFGRMHNDYKLRHALNMCGWEGDKQREVWELGFLAKMNNGKSASLDKSGRTSNYVDYDTLLLMAGVNERDIIKDNIKKGEVIGYRIDEDMASVWYDFYQNSRQLPNVGFLEQVNPKAKEIILIRARNFKRFKDLELTDEQIIDSLNQQFAALHERFTNRLAGLFSGIPSYQRSVAFVNEQVVDAYLLNTFDKSRKMAFEKDSPWPERDWGPEINFQRREQWKCMILRQRKFAIESDEGGFNQWILTQVKRDPKTGKGTGVLYEPYDDDNWTRTADGKPICKFLHGTDEIESWLMGSGEFDFGKGKRLTRLPNYFDKNGLMYLLMAIYSAETAKEVFIHSGHKDWERGLGGFIDYKGHLILKGPWLMVMNPQKMAQILDTLIDPGNYSVFDAEEIRELKEKFGCTDAKVAEFIRERQEIGVMDLEVGPNQALEAQEHDAVEGLDKPIQFIMEIPAIPLGTELGAMLPGKKQAKETNTPHKIATVLKNAGRCLVPLVGGGLVTMMGLPVVGAALAIPAIYTFISIWGKSISTNDIDWTRKPSNKDPITAVLDFVSWYIPERIIRARIGDFTLFSSIYDERRRGRASQMLIEGKRPLWDDIAISTKDACEMVAKQKKELTLEQEIAKSGGGH